MNEDNALQNPVHTPLPETEEEIQAAPLEETPEAGEPDGDAADATEPSACLPTADGQDPDPDPIPALPPAEDLRLEQLVRELADLRQMLNQRQAEDKRVESERAEFSALYPNIALSTLPDSVWEDVSRGIPLAAAYALAERKKLLRDQAAAQSNHQNKIRSAGALDATDSDYFSASEVRSMSPAEVRRNYSKIIQSMSKWH